MSILSGLPKIVHRRAKRLGRGAGSGKGAKSGRGTTRHQAARENIPLHFEGGQAKMVKKYPLLRGKGKNKSVREKPVIVNLEALNAFKDGEVIDLNSLQGKGLVDPQLSKVAVKILARGTVSKKLQVKLAVSRAVKTLIEKAGGTVQSV